MEKTLRTSGLQSRGNSHQPLLMRYPLLQWFSRTTLSPYSTLTDTYTHTDNVHGYLTSRIRSHPTVISFFKSLRKVENVRFPFPSHFPHRSLYHRTKQKPWNREPLGNSRRHSSRKTATSTSLQNDKFILFCKI